MVSWLNYEPGMNSLAWFLLVSMLGVFAIKAYWWRK